MIISSNQGQDASDTYRFLLQLRLGKQLDSLKTGGQPDNFIRLKSLPSLEHSHLKDPFGAICELRTRMGQHFLNQTLG